jgi:DNA-binding winged helix-turn-helix (wHTH) protein/Tol biopolymer transport system component
MPDHRPLLMGPLRFGIFEIDPAARELRKHGLRIKLQDQPFAVLLMLLERPGQLVTKEELQQRLWPADTFVEFDKGIYNAMKRLRETLGDEAGTPRYIETLPRRGYRFIAPVNHPTGQPLTPTPSTASAPLAEPKRETESGQTVSHLAPAAKKSGAIYWLVPMAVIILLASAILLYKRPWSHLETKKQIVLRDLTANNRVGSAVISPDGTQLALVDNDGVSLQQISTGDRRILYKGSDLGLISWYPDGAHLLAIGDNSVGLWKLSTFDGKKQRLLANRNVDKAALSPDGKWIVFADNAPGKVWIMGSNGDNPIELTSLSKAGVFALAWSPTSRRILYRSWSVDKAAIGSCDREGGHEIEIVSNPNLGTPGSNDVYWGRDGRVFYTLRAPEPKTLDSNIWTVPVDPDTGRVTGGPSQVTSYTGLGEGDFSESRNGNQLLFYKERRKDAILIADINPVSGELRRATPLPTGGWNAYTPLWTHDGRKLVFYSNVRGELGFYIEDLQTQEIQPLVTGVEDFGYGPALGTLTSDGKWLLFTRGRRSAGEPAELLRMPLDGGPATPLSTGNFMPQCALRMPVCVLCDVKTDRPSFFLVDPIHGRGALLAHTKSLDPLEVEWSLSPDGRSVAYLPEHNGNQIEILSLEGKSSRTITIAAGHLQSPTWAADNEHFYVVSNQQGKWNMLYVEPSGKYKTAWTSPPGDVWITYPSPSPDGRRLAFRLTSVEGNFAMLENY